MSCVDDYKIALNILAKLGINHPDFIKEYAKAKNMLHQFDSFNAVQHHKNTHVSVLQSPQSTQVGQPDQSTAQEPLGATGLQSAPNTPATSQGQPSVGKYDNI
jgi:hypothetical protein